MPKIYNKKFMLIPTYTPDHLLSEDGKRMDERPIMHIAFSVDWLRKHFAATDPSLNLERFVDEEATYDDFEDLALKALLDDWFAFAAYDDGEENKVVFPSNHNPWVGSVGDMMQAYHEFVREETVFDHISRKAREIPYSARMGCPVGFMPDGDGLIFSDSDPARYATRDGAEQAFIDILRRCGEIVVKNEKTGTLSETLVLAQV